VKRSPLDAPKRLPGEKVILRYAFSFTCVRCGKPIQPIEDLQKRTRSWKGEPEDPHAVEVILVNPWSYAHTTCEVAA